MSILLDALKKSEEQRQLGQGPDIHGTAGDGLPEKSGRRLWIPLVLISAGAIAMAWIGWQQFRQPVPEVATASNSAQAEVPPASEPAAIVNSPAQPEPTVDAPPDAPPPVRRTPVETLPARSETEAGTAEKPERPAQRAKPRASVVNQSFTEFEAAAQAASEGQREAVAENPGTSTAGGSRQSPPDSGQAASAEPHATEPISFWELPQGVRDSLPDLRITVLVYAAQPEDRFLLVGGQRWVEKDKLADGVVLEEIRRDGAVFLYRNYRFLVEG